MRGKSGWIRILEATVAVLIVSGVMLAVYSGQTRGEEASVSEYSYSLQKEILADIVLEPEKRLDVLRVVDDLPGDPAYDRLDAFVDDRIPDSFGYLLRVCELGDDFDFCKMDSEMFIATIDKDVFVEETVISSELGSGDDALYAPKKVRLFFWEGGLPEGFCRNECSGTGYSLGCSDNLRHVVNKSCGEFDGDACFEYNDSFEYDVEMCNSTSLCIGGVCVFSLYSKMVCGLRVDEDLVRCGEGGVGMTADCGGPSGINDVFYYTYLGDSDYVDYPGVPCDSLYYSCRVWSSKPSTGCELNPVCPDGHSEISAVPCAGPTPTVASLSLEFVSDGNYYFYSNPFYYYNHTRVIREHADVGVTLYNLTVCLDSGGCHDEVLVPIVIGAGGMASLTGLNLSTDTAPDVFSVNYSGIDDNQNYVEVVEIIDVDGASWYD